MIDNIGVLPFSGALLQGPARRVLKYAAMELAVVPTIRNYKNFPLSWVNFVLTLNIIQT